ncbi:MAG TPA: class I SAM-dependent methyltransferase [Candidatus Sulfomarinibacteraceae bacterium]|nr:class I SAM-dependent methyltransferase [Candidatus Sulfomarinibacteraceae bacterium]
MTRLDDRYEDLVSDLGGFYRAWLVYLGLELGFFRAIRDAGEAGLSAAGLASRTATDPKAVDTWAWAAEAHGLVAAVDGAVRLDDESAALLLDEQRPEYLGGQFVHSVVATMDWDRMAGFFRTGVPVGARPDRYRAAIEQVTRQDIAVFFAEGLAALPNLVARLVTGGRVLDVHCGGGRWLVAMAQRFPALQLVGIEAEPDSLARARALVAEAGLSDRIRLESVSRTDVSRPGRFDLVYYQYALHFLPDPPASLRASWDVVDPGGALLVLDWLLPTDPDEMRTIQGELTAGVHLDEVFMGAGLQDRATYRRWYAEAGIPAPEVIELPSGATLFALFRP